MERKLTLYSAFFVLMVTIFTIGFATPSYANSKYASLVIDADSGKVLHAVNANARRYPASLTKMMTLYMTFEALKKGRIGMGTRMKVSKKAASMPQTNISLRKGDRITVRDAIKALVVRSANDVAVVLAEQLGKTEWGFGLKMTSKARRLGMKSTVFRNASGLPDSKQYSTARDMAVLSTALKRHFPEYYHFFKTTKFKWKGKTYTSHNRVLKKLPGADGLKTGYIRASGFNVATSAQRQGRNLVAVVMGGKSSKSRDSHMVDLMERSFSKLGKTVNIKQFVKQGIPIPKSRPFDRQIAANKPIPTSKPKNNADIKQVLASLEKKAALRIEEFKKPKAKISVTKVPEKPIYPFQVVKREQLANTKAQPQQLQQPQVRAEPIAVSKTSPFVSVQAQPAPAVQQAFVQPQQKAPQRYLQNNTMVAPQVEQKAKFKPAAYRKLDTPSKVNGRSWGVQVGAFQQSKEALMAAVNATQLAKTELDGSRIVISNGVENNGAMIHRARLANLDEKQAREACQKLISKRESCFVFRLNKVGQSL